MPEDAAAVASLMLRAITSPEADEDQVVMTAYRLELDDRSRFRDRDSISFRVRLAMWVAAVAISLRGSGKVKGSAADAASQAASLLARTSPAESRKVADKVAADPENLPALRKTATDLRKAGVSSRKKKETLLAVVTWLVMLGLPAALPAVPASDQGIIVNEVATVALAIAITDHIRRDKD